MVSVFGIRLGISRIVGQPENRRGRVFYNEDGKWMVPEHVVLSRWRNKTAQAGETYHGFRLPPGTWQTLIEFKETDWYNATIDDVRRKAVRIRRHHPTLGAPPPAMLLVLANHLENLGVRWIVLEHACNKSLRHPEHPGVPDLFLYRKNARGFVEGEKFVEVTRPGEKLSEQQAEELEFLRRLGLGAGLVRLIERP
jgi:hypothetical protein